MMRRTRAKQPNGFLHGAHRITTAPEPNFSPTRVNARSWTRRREVHLKATARSTEIFLPAFQGVLTSVMHFPQFWAQGWSGSFSCWRWSSASLAEAQSSADQAARQLEERFRGRDYPPKYGGYYPDRPFREEIITEINGDAGIAAVVTRNSYGCLVLNTARVMFVDIDLPEPPNFRAKLVQKTCWKAGRSSANRSARRGRCPNRELDAQPS